MNQLKLYENVVIGNFLYGLGASIRAKSSSEVFVSSVNLLQQSPVDTTLGDVLLEFPGIIRLIEFKRPQNKSKKESENVERLNIAISDQKDKFLEISRSVHWFIETDPKQDTFVSRIVPYISAYSEYVSRYSLDQFIELVADEAVNTKSSFSPRDLREYIDLVQFIFADKKSGAGGLILAIGEGKLRFAELTDMTQLKLQHRVFVAEIQREYELLFKLMDIYEESLVQSQQKNIKSQRRSGPSLER